MARVQRLAPLENQRNRERLLFVSRYKRRKCLYGTPLLTLMWLPLKFGTTKPGPARTQCVQSLCNFFQHPAVVVSLARDALSRDVLEGIVAQLSGNSESAAGDEDQQQVNVAQYVTVEREREVKAALMNALPRYLAYVNNEFQLASWQGGSSLTLPRPGDGKVEVFAERMLALLNLRGTTVATKKSLMDDWCDYFLHEKAVASMVDAEMSRGGSTVAKAVEDNLPAYARASMWTEGNGAKRAASQGPRLAGSRFRRLWLLWMKHYEAVASLQSVAATLMLSFADVVQSHVAAGNAAADVFHGGSLACAADTMTPWFEGALPPLVEALWDAMAALHKECLEDTTAAFLRELRAAIRRAKLRRCCMWVSQSGIVWVMLTAVGVGVTVADQVTDVVLGVEHVLEGNTAWAVLTFLFACLPSALQGSLLIPNTCIGRCLKRYNNGQSRCYNAVCHGCNRKMQQCHSDGRTCVYGFWFWLNMALLFLFAIIPLWTPVLAFLVAISPFLGALFIMKWGWQYIRQPGSRPVVEAN